MENTVVTISPSAVPEKRIRVAAYCRVSSDSSDQLHSFSAQVQYYNRLIRENQTMELVDIYADEGITGLKTAKRDDFNRLVNDCCKGRIDRVLTKSVSRFARNTADALMYARMLREHGVTILFEKENIDTAFLSSELLLALSGAQAQEESVSISRNMRWSVERRMKNGTYLASSVPYGYELRNGALQICEREAETVRFIFLSFLSGIGKKDIADALNSSNTPKRFASDTWRINTIHYILTNERYIGDALLQKSYTTDTLPFTRRRNTGEKAQYYVENMNLPIIAKEDFEAVQRIIHGRTSSRSKQAEYVLGKKIRCKCGAAYTPIRVNGKQYWGCLRHNLDAGLCDSPRIPEEELFEAFVTMVNKLHHLRASVILPAISQMERLQMKADGKFARIREIDREIAELSNKNLVLARLNSKGILRAAEYAEQSTALNQKMNLLRAERRRALQERSNDALTGLHRLNDALMAMRSPLCQFDKSLFDQIVEEMSVPDAQSVCFRVIGGLTLRETVNRKGR